MPVVGRFHVLDDDNNGTTATRMNQVQSDLVTSVTLSATKTATAAKQTSNIINGIVGGKTANANHLLSTKSAAAAAAATIHNNNNSLNSRNQNVTSGPVSNSHGAHSVIHMTNVSVPQKLLVPNGKSQAPAAPSAPDARAKQVLKEAVDAVVNSFAKHTQGYGRGRWHFFCSGNVFLTVKYLAVDILS